MHSRTLCTVALSAGALTHELAFTAAPRPARLLAASIAATVDDGCSATIAVAAGLVAGQAVLFALHYFAPSSGDTMVRRFFLWQVLNLFERPGDRQFVIPLVVMVIGVDRCAQRARGWCR